MNQVAAKGLEFEGLQSLGRVYRVDTANVWVLVHDDDSLSRLSVGSLVAAQSAIAGEHLIGTVDRVTRTWGQDELDSPAADSFADSEPSSDPIDPTVERNLVRISLLGTHARLGANLNGRFKRGADTYPRLDAECWVLDADNLERLMGLVASEVPEDRRLNVGGFVSHPSSVATLDGNKWFQRHAAVLGSTGSGKSWAVALFLERASRLSNPNLIVLDMHGEYSSLSEGNEPIGQGFKVAGPQGSESLADGVLHLPWWLLTQDELFALLLDRSEDNAPNQAARFAHHLRELKEASAHAAGRGELADRLTIDSPIPASIDELIARLTADDTEMVPGAKAGSERQGTFYGKLSRFISRLKAKRDDRRYAFMFSPPDEASDFAWLEDLAKHLLVSKPGVKILDFSTVPGDVLPVVVGVLARLMYQVQFWMEESDRTPFTFVCDEAHLYLPATETRLAEQRALDSFERIAKEGRKYGVSLMVVSQRPSDVSRTVLSQCNNFMVLRLTNDQDRSVVQRLVPDNLSGLTDSLPLLDIGEAIVLGDSMILPSRIKLSAPAIKPISATREFWSEWDTLVPSESAVESAIYRMRAQGRV